MGIGMQEMIVIFLIVLLLFGAKKIPELARGIGKGMGEFNKAKQEFEREIRMGEYEGKKSWEQPRVAPSPAPPVAANGEPPAEKQDS